MVDWAAEITYVRAAAETQTFVTGLLLSNHSALETELWQFGLNLGKNFLCSVKTLLETFIERQLNAISLFFGTFNSEATTDSNYHDVSILDQFPQV